jgi:hypothetical protein
MTGEPARVRGLRIALVLTAVFDVLALLLFLRATPTVFTVFMFVGQPLFAVAMVLLLGAVLADLRAKQLL